MKMKTKRRKVFSISKKRRDLHKNKGLKRRTLLFYNLCKKSIVGNNKNKLLLFRTLVSDKKQIWRSWKFERFQIWFYSSYKLVDCDLITNNHAEKIYLCDSGWFNYAMTQLEFWTSMNLLRFYKSKMDACFLTAWYGSTINEPGM